MIATDLRRIANELASLRNWIDDLDDVDGQEAAVALTKNIRRELGELADRAEPLEAEHRPRRARDDGPPPPPIVSGERRPRIADEDSE